jgi:competence protein ComEC
VSELPDAPRLRFVAVDVGQGLAQIGAVGPQAVAWDMGLPSGIWAWQSAYQGLGRPHIEAIVVSHSDWDHCGGLTMLPESLDFSGVIIVHPGEDTTYLREQCVPAWSGRIRFLTLMRGDTICGLTGIHIECLWPLGDLGADSLRESSELRNRYSLVFAITCGETRLLLTSDIDTVAEAAMAREYGARLQGEILVAPHHGSASAADPVFFGYVHPDAAIVSCAAPPNQYGHPSSEFLDLAFQMGITVWTTYGEGSIFLNSNGEYWERD